MIFINISTSDSVWRGAVFENMLWKLQFWIFLGYLLRFGKLIVYFTLTNIYFVYIE